MKQIFVATIFTLVCVLAFSQNQSTAPKIIRTVPAFGDCSVDTGLKEVIIKFDQDMHHEMSMPNNRQMPKITGKPTWINKRALSVPVKLDSSRFYKLSFNNWRFRNFRNVNGVTLNPDYLFFQTKGEKQPDFNKEKYNNLRSVFPKMYSYASKNGVDWSTLIKQNNLENSESEFEFAMKLLGVLKKAEDPHLWMEYKGDKYYPSLSKYYLNNYNIKEIVNALDQKAFSKKNNILSGKIGDIGYICIGTWHKSKANEIRTAIDRLKEFKSLKNIIVDVRPNTGGDEELAKEFASCFIKEPLPYGIIRNFNNKSGKFDRERIKTVNPNKEGFVYEGNVYVLTGPKCISSNEGFISMMKQVKNAKVVGMKTRGSSGNPKPHKLSENLTLYLPSWQSYTLDNKLIEGNGIEPDIEIVNTQADFKGKDGLFDAVVEMINNSH